MPMQSFSILNKLFVGHHYIKALIKRRITKFKIKQPLLTCNMSQFQEIPLCSNFSKSFHNNHEIIKVISPFT